MRRSAASDLESDVTDLSLKHLTPLIHLRAADLDTHALSSVLDLLI
jgi:hypothetical protein